MIDSKLLDICEDKLNRYVCKLLGISYTWGSEVVFIHKRVNGYQLHIYSGMADIADKEARDKWKERSTDILYDININYLGIDKSRIICKYRNARFNLGMHSYVNLTEHELMNIFALIKISK